MGYGDEILVTAEAREIKKKFPNAKILVGNGKKTFPSIIFQNNPNISQNENINSMEDYIWILNYMNNRPYLNYLKSNSERNVWDQEFSAKAGEIYLNDIEKKNGLNIIKKAKKLWEDYFSEKSKILVLIEPNVKGTIYSKVVGTTTAGDANLNRDWGFNKWQKVINALKDKVVFIQPLVKGVKKLSNVIHVDCNFRVALSILNQCDMFLGTHCGYSHAAAALKKDAINIFGGWLSPEIMGYKFHTNYYIDLPDSPCGSRKICGHCKDCMDQIKIEDIVASLEQKIIKKKL